MVVRNAHLNVRVLFDLNFHVMFIDQRKNLNVDLGNASDIAEQDISSTANIVENTTTTNVARVNNFVQQVNYTQMIG